MAQPHGVGLAVSGAVAPRARRRAWRHYLGVALRHALLFTVARNLILTRVRDALVVPIEAVSDLDALNAAIDTPDPERVAIVRDELRRLQLAIDRLPPRCREAFVMGRIQGLTRGEIALRMGVSEKTVTEHFTKAMRLVADIFYAEQPDLGKKHE